MQTGSKGVHGACSVRLLLSFLVVPFFILLIILFFIILVICFFIILAPIVDVLWGATIVVGLLTVLIVLVLMTLQTVAAVLTFLVVVPWLTRVRMRFDVCLSAHVSLQHLKGERNMLIKAVLAT